MPAILGLFNIFSLIYVFRSLQLTATVWRERSAIKQGLLTRRTKSLAEQASFFIAVPIGVFFHELAHAIAVWLFGGQVTQFAYRVFWGFVSHPGTGVVEQEWFISLAGTLGSLLFGITIWLLFRNNSSSTLRYFGLRAFRFQVYFSTIYYPIFTLLGFEGDWRTIYNFSATPILSGLVVPFHLGLVGLFWWGDRTGWFERPFHETVAAQEQYAALQQQAAFNPHDNQVQLQFIDVLHRGGAVNRAKTQLKQFLKQNPDSAAAYLKLAELDGAGKSQITPRASEMVRRALSLGLPNPASRAYAHQILGKYYLDRNETEKAVTHLTEALAQKVDGEDTAVSQHKSSLYHLRSQAYRRQRQYELAYQDIQLAYSLAQEIGNNQLMAYYNQEREIIKNHAGQSLVPEP